MGPILFGRVQLILMIDQVHIIKVSPEKSNLDLIKIILTRPKPIEPGQHNLYSSTTIWTVQNDLELIEGP